MDLARLLQQAREAKAWSPPDLGRRAKVNPVTIYRIEDGTTRAPEGPTVRKLAQALDIPWDVCVQAAPYLAHEEGVSGGDAPAGPFPRLVPPAPRVDAGAGDAGTRGRPAAAGLTEAALRTVLHETLRQVVAPLEARLTALERAQAVADGDGAPFSARWGAWAPACARASISLDAVH
jgi:transcriptional regulator with XRE-family HTH domain